MAQQDRDEPSGKQLSERIENHRKEVQFLVKQGGEQPEYEFKPTVSLARENLDDRLDFIKLMQALANAELTGERCIVVGADPREKKFYPVTNQGDLDAANISKILHAYLHPVPRFNVFHLTTDDVVLIVLDGDQPRPITVMKQGHTSKGLFVCGLRLREPAEGNNNNGQRSVA